jgi:hypothetical protein
LAAVEHGEALLDRHRLRPVLTADARDELDDRLLRRSVAPARQLVEGTGARAFGGGHEPHGTETSRVTQHPDQVITPA